MATVVVTAADTVTKGTAMVMVDMVTRAMGMATDTGDTVIVMGTKGMVMRVTGIRATVVVSRLNRRGRGEMPCPHLNRGD